VLQPSEALVRAAAQRVHDLLELAAAEIRLAAHSGLTMLLLLMIASAALVIAWGLLVACVLYWCSRTPLGWPLPAFCIAVCHVFLAYYLWNVAVRLSGNLTLPEVRRTAFGAERPERKPNEVVELVSSGS
jgi:hypothetical protein